MFCWQSPEYAEMLMTGRVKVEDLTPSYGTEVRVFLCSSGTDMKAEQKVLMENVYPNLREYCRREHEMEFYVFDSRFEGVGLDWSPLENKQQIIRLKEIENCQRVSVGPNFVALFGQRYGDCPLPSHISAPMFLALRAALDVKRSRETRDAPLLDGVYKLDENSLEPMYALQTDAFHLATETIRANQERKKGVMKSEPTSKEIKISIGEGEIQRAKELIWSLLLKGANLCAQLRRLGCLDDLDLFKSDFEKEIEFGISRSTDPNRKCIAFMRTIVDLKNYVQLPVARNFCEIAYSNAEKKFHMDAECHRKLEILQENKLKKWVTEERNITTNKILWRFDDGVCLDQHKDYLTIISDCFSQKLKGLIESAVETKPPPRPPLHEEVFQHWVTAREYTQEFVGQAPLLDLVKAYLISNDDKPLVLYGESGTGKTATVGKVALQAGSWIGQEDTIVVVRFVGTTMQSRDLFQLLLSISAQISIALGEELEDVPNSFQEIQDLFLGLIECFPKDRNLVLLLDSIDCLLPEYDSILLNWLPLHFGENVKVVVTLRPCQTMLERLRQGLIADANNYVQMSLLSPRECSTLLSRVLAGIGRRLTTGQMACLSKDHFSICAPPLYIHLIASLVSDWTSDTCSDCVPGSMEDCVVTLFRKLQRCYGDVFFGRVMSILTASINGFSDSEMEDILSSDDVAMKTVSGEKSYNSRIGLPHRIPPIAWVRIRHDLRPFLRRSVSDGVTVWYWNNSVFEEVVHSLYMTDEQYRQCVHSLIADYWLGCFSGECRGMVISQPIIIRQSDSCRPNAFYNLRKLRLLPFHLYMSGRQPDLQNCVFFNFDWLYNKIKAFSLQQVLSDFRFSCGPEAKLLETALREGSLYIEGYPNNLAVEVTGRLLSYYETHPLIRRLIDECDCKGLDQNCFLVNFPYRQMPGGALKHTVQCEHMPHNCSIVTGQQSEILLTKDPNCVYIEVVDLSVGEHQGVTPTSIGKMFASSSGRHVAIVDYPREKSIKIHNLETGRFVGHLIPIHYIGNPAKDKQELSHVVVTERHVCFTVTAEQSWLGIADLNDLLNSVTVFPLKKRPAMCSVTPDEKYVFTNAATTLYGYSLDEKCQVTDAELDECPSLISFAANGCKGFIASVTNKLMMVTIDCGKVETLVKIDLCSLLPEDCIRDVSSSVSCPDMLLVRGDSNLIVYNLQLDQVVAHIPRPSEVPCEFRLPKSTSYTHLSFTDAKFSANGNFVIGSIFRDVYIWQISGNCRLLSVLRTPIGVIRQIFVTASTNQVITSSVDSQDLLIWSVDEAICHVGTLDRMTSPIKDIVITCDSSKAFVACNESDEVGVFDMNTGHLMDLLTHELPVSEFTIDPCGHFALVSLIRSRPGTCNKIWNVRSRRVLYEFGNVPAVTLPTTLESGFFSFLKPDLCVDHPYVISFLRRCEDHFTDEPISNIGINHLLQKPFLTDEDRFLVVHSAEGFDQPRQFYYRPFIRTYSLRFPTHPVVTYTPDSLSRYVPTMTRILHARPCPSNAYTIVIIYTNEPDCVGRTCFEHNFGFLILDVCSSIVCQIIDDFLPPLTILNHVLFTRDIRLCVDQESNVYDMANGFCLVNMFDGECTSGVRPLRLILNDTTLLYADGEYLMAVRIADAKCLGRIGVHSCITTIEVCDDNRTVVVGCSDGSLVSYVLADVIRDVRQEIIGCLATRMSRASMCYNTTAEPNRFWDKVDPVCGVSPPGYARPPSSIYPGGPSDQQLLSRVKLEAPPQRSGFPLTSSHLYNLTSPNSSQVCSVM